jgi:hypothetical protein
VKRSNNQLHLLSGKIMKKLEMRNNASLAIGAHSTDREGQLTGERELT